ATRKSGSPKTRCSGSFRPIASAAWSRWSRMRPRRRSSSSCFPAAAAASTTSRTSAAVRDDAEGRSHAHRAGGSVMMRAAQQWVAAVTACSLLAPPATTAFAAQAATAAQKPAGQPAAAKPAAPPTAAKTAAKPAARSTDIDGGWPRAYTAPSGAGVFLYQPQIASWTDQKQMVAFVAVSYMPKGAQKAALGTIKLEAATRVAISERLVSFSDFRVTESNFQTLEADQKKTVLADIQSAIPTDERVLAL